MKFGESQFENGFGARPELVGFVDRDAGAFVVLAEKTVRALPNKSSLLVGRIGAGGPGQRYRDQDRGWDRKNYGAMMSRAKFLIWLGTDFLTLPRPGDPIGTPYRFADGELERIRTAAGGETG